jgi:hypothetical protein
MAKKRRKMVVAAVRRAEANAPCCAPAASRQC